VRGALRPQEVLFLSRLNYRTRAALALRNYRYATAQGHHGFAAAQPSWLVAPNFTAAQVLRPSVCGHRAISVCWAPWCHTLRNT
jgi:hypothetical protein